MVTTIFTSTLERSVGHDYLMLSLHEESVFLGALIWERGWVECAFYWECFVPAMYTKNAKKISAQNP